MLVEIHMLQNHSPANLNRDDLGAPKTCIFGGFPRARVSSQCLKRSIRKSKLFEEALEGHIGTRTRSFPARVNDELSKSTIPAKYHKRLIEACSQIAKAEEKEAASGLDETVPAGEMLTGQLIHLGPSEADLFVQALCKLEQENLPEFEKFLREPCPSKPTAYSEALRKAFRHTASDIALFGRMTTSPAFENVEASMQVAHAISTHEVTPEVDYFTAMDDDPRGRLGAGLVKENQFLSATFYKYFSLNWAGLVDNLNGDSALAERTLDAFVRAAAQAVPSGKINSHAHNNPPDCILIEVKKQAVPTSYANAFVDPARQQADVVSESIRMLAQYAREVAESYGIQAERLWLATRAKDQTVDFGKAERKRNLDELIQATLKAVRPA